MNELKNYGFKPEQVIITEEDWKLGSNLSLSPSAILRKDGQYDDFLPVYEPQAEKYETDGCTCWGLQNQIEIYMKVAYGFEPNFSERFTYNDAGVTRGGVSPTLPYESCRKHGLVNQEVLPIPSTYEEFCTPRPVSSAYLNEAKKWLNKYEFFHEWIRPANPTKMKELIKTTLPFGPIGLSVTAWFQDENGLYVDNGLPNSHWCVCYGYTEDARGIILKIFDSYDHSTKLLHPDHVVSFAKRISIVQKNGEVQTATAIELFLKWLFNRLGIAWRN